MRQVSDAQLAADRRVFDVRRAFALADALQAQLAQNANKTLRKPSSPPNKTVRPRSIRRAKPPEPSRVGFAYRRHFRSGVSRRLYHTGGRQRRLCHPPIGLIALVHSFFVERLRFIRAR
jgi:hypothetical protein